MDDIPIIEETEGGYLKDGEFVQENMSDFFPTEDYKVPQTASNYMKFEEGLNRIRILSSAIVGYQYFTTENKPVRSREPFEDTPLDIKPGRTPKHFWAFVVWNYNEKKIQVLEITQKSIMMAIKSLIDNSKWGNPKNYDIAITKTGDKLDTEYGVQGEPPIGEVDPDILAEYEARKINLEALYDGTDPFSK